MKRVTFQLEGQGFAAEVLDDGDIGRFWIIGEDGQEVEDKHNAIWNNLDFKFLRKIGDAAETAAKERE